MLNLEQCMRDHGYTRGEQASGQKLAKALLEQVPDAGTLANVSNQVRHLLNKKPQALTWWTSPSRTSVLEALCQTLDIDQDDLLNYLDPTRHQVPSYEVWPAGTSALLRPFIHGHAPSPPLEMPPHHVGVMYDSREWLLLNRLYGSDVTHMLSLVTHHTEPTGWLRLRPKNQPRWKDNVSTLWLKETGDAALAKAAYYPALSGRQVDEVRLHEQICFERAAELLDWLADFLRHDAQIDVERCHAWIETNVWRPDGLHDWCMILSFLHHSGMRCLDLEHWCTRSDVARALLAWFQEVCPAMDEQVHIHLIEALCDRVSEVLEVGCALRWTEEEYEEFSAQLDEHLKDHHDIRAMSRRMLFDESLSKMDRDLCLMKPGEFLCHLGVVCRQGEGYELSHFFARRLMFGLWYEELSSCSEAQLFTHLGHGLAISAIHHDVRDWLVSKLLESPDLAFLDVCCPHSLVEEDARPELFELRVLETCVLEVGCSILRGELDDSIPHAAWPRLERLHDALCQHLFLLPSERIQRRSAMLQLVSPPQKLIEMLETPEPASQKLLHTNSTGHRLQKSSVHTSTPDERSLRLMCMLALTEKVSRTRASRASMTHTPLERLIGHALRGDGVKDEDRRQYAQWLGVLNHGLHANLVRWQEPEPSVSMKLQQWMFRCGMWTLDAFGEAYQYAHEHSWDWSNMAGVQQPVYLARLMIRGHDALEQEEPQHLTMLADLLVKWFEPWVCWTHMTHPKKCHQALETFWWVLKRTYEYEPPHRKNKSMDLFRTLLKKLYPQRHPCQVHDMPETLRRQIHHLGFWTTLQDSFLSTVLEQTHCFEAFAHDASKEVQDKLLGWMGQDNLGGIIPHYVSWLSSHQDVVPIMSEWLRCKWLGLTWLNEESFLEHMWERDSDHLWTICLDLMKQELEDPEQDAWHLRQLLYSMPSTLLERPQNSPVALLETSDAPISLTMCNCLRVVCVRHLEQPGPDAQRWFALLQQIQDIDPAQASRLS